MRHHLCLRVLKLFSQGFLDNFSCWFRLLVILTLATSRSWSLILCSIRVRLSFFRCPRSLFSVMQFQSISHIVACVISNLISVIIICMVSAFAPYLVSFAVPFGDNIISQVLYPDISREVYPV